MSELTTCNYCKLQRYKKEAKKEGCKIVVRKVLDTVFSVGFEIFKLPKDEKLPKNLFYKDAACQKYFISWMKEVGNKCEC